jgi:ATP-dependent DNA helicase PIF1
VKKSFQSIERTNCVTYIESDKLIEPEILLKCQALSLQETTYELETMVKNVGIEKNLKLKCGAFVMCTYNIDLENGICNGSQGIIVDFKETVTSPGVKLPVVLFSNGLKRIIDYQYWQNEDYPSIVVAQIPLCLAWALTIHKIQGATLEMADMDLGKSIFEYGQVYVALSRIRTLNGLYISEFYPHRIKANPIVKSFYSSLTILDEDYTNEVVYETEEKRKVKIYFRILQ